MTTIYRGKYPTRIHDIGGSQGNMVARTNEGGVYAVCAVNGKAPAVGSDIADWPRREFLYQSTKRRGVGQ